MVDDGTSRREERISKAEISAPLSFHDYEYEVVLCENGMRVLLVSSEKVDKSACAIGVGVGSMGDFDFKYEGLAHFCEHMLFMGTARFPDEQEYQQYVQQNGGMTNAFTSDMETVYYATVKPEGLDGLVDRTAEFFISPAFNESAVNREVEAVNSEHEKNLQSDSRRKYHLQKFLANPNHPFHTFSTGSNATLRRLEDFDGDQEKSLKALRDKLLSFHAKNYSSNNMACVVIGRESLADLEKMVLPRIEKIPNKNVPIIRGSKVGAPEPCFRPEKDLSLMVDVYPVKEGDRRLEIRFVLPDQRDVYESKPANFVSHILGHEGEGSILSILKREGVATSLFAGLVTENNGQSLFTITMDLVDDDQFTDEKVGYCVKMCQSVLMDLQETQDLSPLVDDEVKVDFIRWNYRPLFSVEELVTDGVRNLLAYKPAEVFSAAYVNVKPDVAEVRKLVDHIVENFKKAEIMIWRTATKFDCSKSEPVYGTKYNVMPLPPAMAESIKSLSPQSGRAWLKQQGYKSVVKNKFVPDSFAMKDTERVTDVLAAPVLHQPSPSLAVYHKFENSFNLPQFVFSGRIVSPLLRSSNEDLKWLKENDVTRAKIKPLLNKASKISELPKPARVALYYVYQRTVMESVNESLYDARLAGVLYELSIFNGRGKGPCGLDFLIGGFDDKGEEVMKIFIDSTHQFDVTDSHLTTSITQLVTKFTNKCKTTDPYIHVMEKGCEVTSVDFWDAKDILEALVCITPEIARKFLMPGGQLTDELFDGSYVVGSLVGNVLNEEVEKCYANPEVWSKLIKRGAPVNMTELNDRVRYGDFKLNKLEKKLTASSGKGFTANIVCIKGTTPNPDDSNSAVLLSVEMKDSAIESMAFNNVFTIWMGDKFFDDLRTKQTLGYVVTMPLRENGNLPVRLYLAQSTRTTEYVLSRILNFIQEKLLTEVTPGEWAIKPPTKLSTEEFDKCRNAVIAQLSEKPKEIATLQERINGEIMTGRNDFMRRQKQVEFLKKYTTEHFLKDLETALKGNWLASLVYPESKESFELNVEEELSKYKWCNVYVAPNFREIVNQNRGI